MTAYTADIQRQLAEDISKGLVLDNWLYWVVLMLLFFLASAAGAYFGAYFRKRGETAATKADADDIRERLKQLTTDAVEIKSQIAQVDWIERERLTIRRTKLEECISALFDDSDWLDTYTKANIFDGSPPDRSEPIERVDMLITLYFPELASEKSIAYEAHKKLCILLLEVRQDLLGKSPQERIQTVNETQPKVLEARKKFLSAKAGLQIAAQKLMQTQLIPGTILRGQTTKDS